MVDVISLAQYVICCFAEKKATVTNLKLQKTLYYIQGYFIKEFGEEAFEDEIYCWQYGPVIPMVYYEYSRFGSSPLQCESSYCVELSSREKKLIDKIVLKCKDIASFELVEKTHQESPWQKSEKGKIISKYDIKDFFESNNPLEI